MSTKTNSMTRNMGTLFLAGTLTLLAGTLTLANQEGSTAARSASGFENKFAFDGGTVGEYVESIRTAFPNANIVIEERAGEFKMPAMKLGDVNIQSLLWLLEETPGTSGNKSYLCTVEQFDANANPIFRITSYQDHSARQNQVGRGQRASTNQASVPPSTTSVNSVARTVALGMDPGDIISALELALEVNGHEPGSTTITYHEPTRLMIVHGSFESAALAEEVLDQVSSSAKTIDDWNVREDAKAALPLQLPPEIKPCELEQMTQKQLRQRSSEIARARQRLSDMALPAGERDKLNARLQDDFSQVIGRLKSLQESDQG